MIAHDILFSCFFLVKQQQQKTDLKGILSDGSCFSVERRVISLLRSMKCMDYVSCQVVGGGRKGGPKTANRIGFFPEYRNRAQYES